MVLLGAEFRVLWCLLARVNYLAKYFWEKRVEGVVACETPKRAKGIEADYVILATLNENIRDNEMYVGASRARTNLIIVGPKSFKERFLIA